MAGGDNSRAIRRLENMLSERRETNPVSYMLSFRWSEVPVEGPGTTKSVNFESMRRKLGLRRSFKEICDLEEACGKMDDEWEDQIRAGVLWPDEEEEEGSEESEEPQAKRFKQLKNEIAILGAEKENLDVEKEKVEAENNTLKAEIAKLKAENQRLRVMGRPAAREHGTPQDAPQSETFAERSLAAVRADVALAQKVTVVGSRSDMFRQAEKDRVSPNVIEKFNIWLQRNLFTKGKEKEDMSFFLHKNHMNLVFGALKAHIEDLDDQGVGASWLFRSYWAAARVDKRIWQECQQPEPLPLEDSDLFHSLLEKHESLSKAFSDDFATKLLHNFESLAGKFVFDEGQSKENLLLYFQRYPFDLSNSELRNFADIFIDDVWKLHEVWRALGAIAGLAICRGVKLPENIYSSILMSDILMSTSRSINCQQAVTYDALKRWKPEQLLTEMEMTLKEKFQATDVVEMKLEFATEEWNDNAKEDLRLRLDSYAQRLAYVRLLRNRRFALFSLKRGFRAVHPPILGPIILHWNRLDASFIAFLFGPRVITGDDVIKCLGWTDSVSERDRMILVRMLSGFNNERLRDFLEFSTNVRNLPPPGENIIIQCATSLEERYPQATTCHKKILITRAKEDRLKDLWKTALDETRSGTLKLEDRQ